MSPEDLDVSMANIHAEEHTFTKSNRQSVTPQQFLLWDLEPNRIEGKLFLQFITGSLVMIIVHSKSEVTLQKNFPLTIA